MTATKRTSSPGRVAEVPARLVVLASGGGTTLQAILDDPELGPRVVAVGSDRPGIGALDRAPRSGRPPFTVPFAAYADGPHTGGG